jgi:hypothetical protein
MSRSQFVSRGVIAERERQKSQLREVCIPLYMPMPEPYAGQQDVAEADTDEEADVFVVWGGDDSDE